LLSFGRPIYSPEQALFLHLNHHFQKTMSRHFSYLGLGASGHCALVKDAYSPGAGSCVAFGTSRVSWRFGCIFVFFAGTKAATFDGKLFGLMANHLIQLDFKNIYAI
jgi:hypothetical protein